MIGIFLSNVFQTAEKLGLNQRQMLEIIKEIGYGYVEADWNQIRKMPNDFFEMMKELVNRQFMNLDESYLDRLMDELYPVIFEDGQA